MSVGLFPGTLRIVDLKDKLDHVSEAAMKTKSRELRDYIQSISPVDTGEMRAAWRYSYQKGRDVVAKLWNDIEYLPYVRAYYIRRKRYDFVNDAIADWIAGKPARPRLTPPPLKYEVEWVQISVHPWSAGQYKTDKAVLMGTIFRLKPPRGARPDKEQLQKDAEKVLEYLQSCSPVDTGKMKRSWKFLIEPKGTILFINAARTKKGVYYLPFPRRYYIDNRNYDLIKDAVLDFNVGLTKRPTLRPIGR